jgi:molybdopterin-binding protein
MALRTVRDAAGQLGIGYSTLKLWIHQGYARSTTTAGGHHRLSDAEIARLAAQHRATSNTVTTNRDESSYLDGLSARNRLRGFVEEVRIDGLLGQVRLRIGDQRLTAVITRDAIEALRLRRGDDAFAIVKSTEVMIARVLPEAPQARGRAPRRSVRR